MPGTRLKVGIVVEHSEYTICHVRPMTWEWERETRLQSPRVPAASGRVGIRISPCISENVFRYVACPLFPRHMHFEFKSRVPSFYGAVEVKCP
jgi:hypothetical protein